MSVSAVFLLSDISSWSFVSGGWVEGGDPVPLEFWANAKRFGKPRVQSVGKEGVDLLTNLDRDQPRGRRYEMARRRFRRGAPSSGGGAGAVRSGARPGPLAAFRTGPGLSAMAYLPLTLWPLGEVVQAANACLSATPPTPRSRRTPSCSLSRSRSSRARAASNCAPRWRWPNSSNRPAAAWRRAASSRPLSKALRRRLKAGARSYEAISGACEDILAQYRPPNAPHTSGTQVGVDPKAGRSSPPG
jgi:hypothetical protein